jgi:hypothetical protein
MWALTMALSIENTVSKSAKPRITTRVLRITNYYNVFTGQEKRAPTREAYWLGPQGKTSSSPF